MSGESIKRFKCIKEVRAEEEMKNDQPGYKVKYEDGYESWSPKKAFEEGYVPFTTFIDRLLFEYKELTERTNQLSKFINSDMLQDLSVEQIDLLALQLDTMNHYRYILQMRMNLEGVQYPDDFIDFSKEEKNG